MTNMMYEASYNTPEARGTCGLGQTSPMSPSNTSLAQPLGTNLQQEKVTVNGDEDAASYRTSAIVIDIEASLAAGWGLKHVLELGLCLHS